jgi:hypothetical protein
MSGPGIPAVSEAPARRVVFRKSLRLFIGHPGGQMVERHHKVGKRGIIFKADTLSGLTLSQMRCPRRLTSCFGLFTLLMDWKAAVE